jgi:NADPH:quinone reductase-like Zn-dependent oxidoreductase
MRAIVIPKNGPPEVFEEREVEERRLMPQDVRVRVEAAGVNFADLMGRVGLYPDAPPLPYAPGYEVSGVVTEAGAKADAALRPGTRVLAVTRFWGYADTVRVPSWGVCPIPDSVGFAEGAALPVNYLTAYLALIHVGNARPGERVLVHGGAGGVGLAALDLAKPLGVEVYATAGSDEKCRFLESRGVVKAVNYRTTDYEQALKDATRNRGFHLILDPLGPESFEKGLRLLAPLGRVICFGFSTLVTGKKRSLWHAATTYLSKHKVNPITLMNQNAGVFGLNLAHLFDERDLQRQGLSELVRRAASGEIRPTIAKTFPLTARGAADAHGYLHDRLNVGKVVLVRS